MIGIYCSKESLFCFRLIITMNRAISIYSSKLFFSFTFGLFVTMTRTINIYCAKELLFFHINDSNKLKGKYRSTLIKYLA